MSREIECPSAHSCRVCHSPNVKQVGEVEYYTGFAWAIYDCLVCSCRFTRHEELVYDLLHTRANSRYGPHRITAERCKLLFDARDSAELRRELCSSASKNAFIIRSVESRGKSSRVLEIGCSRGYLTSYFILAGYSILGTDISAEAITAAKADFGDFFATPDSKRVRSEAPYDIVYHVGTIGCVADPVTLTRDLLNLLKPGGQLLFNAPNVYGCHLEGQPWLDEAPPPDVVTLFHPGFWQKSFSDVAEVVEEVESYPPSRSATINLRKLIGRKWEAPMTVPLEDDPAAHGNPQARRRGAGERMWSLAKRGAAKLAGLMCLPGLRRLQPTPFGLFVTMTKK